MATRERSPNYPTIDLEHAIAAIDAIHKKEKRGTVLWSLAAKAMGYQGLSGPVRSRIAALKQYGLIDIPTPEHLRVSQRGFDLVASPKNSPEYMAAVRDAAMEPPLFRELHPLQESLDETLEWRLQRERKFSLDGARRAVRAFRATMAFAKLDEDGYDEDVEQDAVEREAVHEARMSAPTTRGGSTAHVQGGGYGRSVQLPLSATAWATLEAPFPLSEDAWDQMIAVLKAMKPGLVVTESPRTTVEAPGDDPPVAHRGLSAEANELLAKVDDGGVPAFTSNNLVRVANENGVAASPEMTPNEIIEQLRQSAS